MKNARSSLVLIAVVKMLGACSHSAGLDTAHGGLTGTEEAPGMAVTGDPTCPEGKALICHQGETLCVGVPAVQAHQTHHGDAAGACTPADTGCDPTEGTAEAPADSDGGTSCGGNKVLVCHIPPGNPSNAHTLCIGKPAVSAHLKHHGDSEGPCPEEPAAPPSGDQCEPIGNGCTTSAECSTNVCIDGTCRQPIGAPCTNSNECASGVCADGTCQGLPPGAACTQNAQCASGSCVEGHCGSVIPPGELPDGSPCTTNEECASDSCDEGVCVGIIN